MICHALGDLTRAQTAHTMKNTRLGYATSDPDFDADAQLIMPVCVAKREQRLLLAIAAECPTAIDAKDLDNVLHMVSETVSSNVYKLASKPAHVQHPAFNNVLFAIVNGFCPDVSVTNSDFAMATLCRAFSYFVRVNATEGKGGATTTHIGVAALIEMRKAADTCQIRRLTVD